MTRPDRLAEAHDRLVAAIEQLTTGEDWRRFLDTARRFRTYSLNNLLLIFAQRPDATQVAGYRTWQSLGRQVRRGERGIAILAPCTYRPTDNESDDSDDEHSGEARRVLRGFKAVHVFDVGQTDGEPLAGPPVHLLEGDDPHHVTDRLAELIRAQGYTFTIGAMPPGHDASNGVSDHDSRAVIVRHDLAPAQQAKTAAHELAHVLLHADRTTRPERPVCEIEAESVAYLVCGQHGLASDAYSFGYVATWAGGDTAAIRGTGERVIACAGRILDALADAAPSDRAA